MTIIAFVVVALLYVLPDSVVFVPESQSLAILMVGVSSLSILLFGMINLIPLIPLQRAESKVTPRVVELFQGYRFHGWTNLMLVFFPLLSCVFFFFLFDSFDGEATVALFAVWIILLGVTLDFLYKFFYYLFVLLNPYRVIREYSSIADYLEGQGNVSGACEWLGTLSETGFKAIHRYSTTLAFNVVNEASVTAQGFLEKWRRQEVLASAPLTEEQVHERHYPFYFLMQRMEFLFDQALEKRLELICTPVITNLGKIAAAATRCGIPVAGFTLHLVGKCAQKAFTKDFEEVAVKASCALEEVAKTLIADPEAGLLDLKSSVLMIIDQMDVIAKEMFRRNKNINVTALSQPFHEMKTLFDQEPLRSHPDYDAISTDLERVIGEYMALDHVMLGKARMEESDK